MRTKICRRVSIVLAIALALCAIASAGWAASGVALAADNTVVETLNAVHMSDIHYFPLDYCYQKVNEDDYETSEFYHSTTGDTKLVLESGVILNNAVHKVIEKVKAEAEAGTAPMYFLATGDLSKNGERAALIDVANALRFMQNEIRKVPGYENFQVLAQVGNHDLYNTDAALYDPNNGKELIADAVTASQFALIFAGLGFPNANLDGSDGAVKLTDYMPEEYWCSDYTSGYQASKNAENLTISYYSPALASVATAEDKIAKYFEIGDGINQLSYSVEIANSGFGFLMFDSADREATVEGKPVRVSKAEFDFLQTKSESQVYYSGTAEGSIDFDEAITAEQATAIFAQDGAVYRAATYAHITGGRLTENVIAWAEHFANDQHQKAGDLGEKTLIAAFHHNLLPHFDVEDDILKDFTLYNWEYTAKRFAAMGVRYVLTGHQHSSDIAAYTDAEGRTIYDSETGSMVSYESPRRYVSIKRYRNADGKLAESFDSAIYATENMAEIASSHIDQDNVWNGSAYDTAIAAYNASKTPENWQAVLASNPNFVAYIIAHERLSTRNYNQYIGEEIYTRLVDRVLDHFLTDGTVNGLVDSVYEMISNIKSTSTAGMVLNALGLSVGPRGALKGVAEYLIDYVRYHLYPDNDGNGIGDYPYKGKTYDGIVEYLRAIIDDLVNMEFGDASLSTTINPANSGKLTLKEMAGFIMMAHTTGTEIKLVTTDAELQAEYAAINSEFTEQDASKLGLGDFVFKNPIDKTYRKRMTAAVKDAHEQLVSGKFAEDLVNALLDPLYRNDDALLRVLVKTEFNIQDIVDAGKISQKAANSITNAMKSTLPDLLNMLELGDAKIPPIDMSKFSVEGIVNSVLGVVKPLVADLIGFNLSGDSLFEIIDNALAGYLTDSFFKGLGGIADEIVVAYATDNFPDIKDMKDASKSFHVQPYAGFDNVLTYDSSRVAPSAVGAAFNPATQDNGRVPSRLTANFDTVDSTGSFTFKFYTDEEVYANFKYKTQSGDAWTELSTSRANADEGDYLTSTASATTNGIKVEMTTQTRPAYVPLIDLGLAALTHGEIVVEDADGDEIPIKYGQRDIAASNSVIYKNVTTVTVSGLKADTTYYYDIEGVYLTSKNTQIKFSLAQNAGVDYYTFTTAKDEKADSFEFLTIADIQGMIQSMYDDSHKAVEALLKDSRTKDFDFLLNAGDMVDNGKNFRQWGMALNTYEDLFANTSQFFTAGNHEDGKNAFATYFNYTLPCDADDSPLQEDITDGAFYSFNYANSHFTVLNTNDANGNGLGDTQLEWLKEDLKSAQDKQWRFVLMHKSLFSGGSHSYDGEVVAMRAQLVPLFKENNVNIVFAGHDHTYTTTKLLAADGSVVDKPDLSGVRYAGDGVLFVTLGTLGTKYYTYGENANVTPKFDKDNSVLHTLTSQTFGKVKVSADEIVFTGYVYDPDTDSVRVIGEPLILSAEKVFAAANVYIIIGVVVGVVAIAAIVATLLIVKKKKARAASESEQTLDEPASDK